MKKKNNMAYWDSMEAECSKLLTTLLTDYACDTPEELDDDARIDISKSILETVIGNARNTASTLTRCFRMSTRIIKLHACLSSPERSME